MHCLQQTPEGYRSWHGEQDGPHRLVGTEEYVRLVKPEHWEGTPQDLRYFALCVDLGRLPQRTERQAAGLIAWPYN